MLKYDRALLKKTREDAGFTQTELAVRVGVKSSSVKDWEVGKCMPNAERLGLLASVLKVPLDTFYRKTL
jgi:transcriptional regulator with XRE-family HTH domain